MQIYDVILTNFTNFVFRVDSSLVRTWHIQIRTEQLQFLFSRTSFLGFLHILAAAALGNKPYTAEDEGGGKGMGGAEDCQPRDNADDNRHKGLHIVIDAHHRGA